MSQYHTFTAHDAVAYAQQFAGIDNPSELVSAQEVGDGNLNLVFKVFDRQGVSRAIVKQALPYVRCVGESSRTYSECWRSSCSSSRNIVS